MSYIGPAWQVGNRIKIFHVSIDFFQQINSDDELMDIMPYNLSLAEKTGLAAFVVAGALLAWGTWLYVLPLICFLLCCLFAPFIPNWSFFLPITSRGDTSTKSVALSFDDGPDPCSTPAILQLLAKNNIQATFFVLGYRAKKYPELIRMILDKGHHIGNHSYSHDPFIMLKTTGKLTREIHMTQKILRQHGIVPLAFRPPVGITNPRLKKVLSDAGLLLINFTHRSADLGNRLINGLAERILKSIQAGEIIVLHDKCPVDKKNLDTWLHELERLIHGIESKGLSIVPLDELINRQVMIGTEET